LATSFEPESVMEFGREPASSCYFAASKLDDRPNFSFEPASVMEFGFYYFVDGLLQIQYKDGFIYFCLRYLCQQSSI